jgi:hypothetical protein
MLLRLGDLGGNPGNDFVAVILPAPHDTQGRAPRNEETIYLIAGRTAAFANTVGVNGRSATPDACANQCALLTAGDAPY